MTPKFSEDFAWWIVERLMDEQVLEVGWNVDDNYYPEADIKKAIRRILMESEREDDN